MNRIIYISAILLMAFAVLFCNLFFPPYYHFEFLFLLPVVLTVWMRMRLITIKTGILSSFLLIASYFLSRDSFHISELVYIAVPFSCIWIFVYVVYLYKQQSEASDIVNERLSAMFNNATEGIIISNPEGKIVMVNPRAESMFGYPEGSLMGKQIELLIPESSRAVHVKHRRKYSTEGHSRPMGKGYTLYGRRKDDSQFPIEISLSTFNIKDELYIISFMVDATERKMQEEMIARTNEDLERRVEERTRELATLNVNLQNEMNERIRVEDALRNSERLYNAIARNFPNGYICVLDRQYKYVFLDGTELHNLGYVRERIEGRHMNDIPILSCNEDTKKYLESVFDWKSVHFDVQEENNVYEVMAVPLPDAKGFVKDILLVVQNVTDIRNADKEIRESLDKERELNDLKSKFVSIASHEFRTPLSTILSSVTLLEKYNQNNDAEKHFKHVERIKSSVKNLTEILNDFLSLEKLEAGKVEAHNLQFNLVGFAKDLCEEMQVAAKPGQQIVYQHSGTAEDIFLDRYLLRNICINLLHNAIKYSPEGSNIEFSTHVNEMLSVTIRDYGMGIPKEDQQHLFERFFRGHNVTAIQGTGLGLNIVMSYVKLMNGTISYVSDVNAGSEFTLKFPISVAAEIA